jgi:4-hydroxybenzoate polyprenyltransferase
MKKQTQKLTRQEKEKIENRLLAIFATALGGEMVLMYVMNWIQGSAGFRNTAIWIIYTLIIGFIGTGIYLKLKSKDFSKKEQKERAEKYNNWFMVCIAGFICAFFVYPTEIISGFFRLIWLGQAGISIVTVINKFNFLTGNPITTRIILLMIIIGVFTVGAFIYYGIQTKMAHKASLNKGKNK